MARIEVILKNAPSTSTELVNFFAKFQEPNPMQPRGMSPDLFIPVLGLFVVDLAHLRGPSGLPPIPHFFLDIEKSKLTRRKNQGKKSLPARIPGIVGNLLLTMSGQKMYHR